MLSTPTPSSIGTTYTSLTRGWAYRHYKNAAKMSSGMKSWLLVALEDEVPLTPPYTFGADTPTFLTGDGEPNAYRPYRYLIEITAGSGYHHWFWYRHHRSVGSGLTVNITADPGEITDVNIADIGDGLYEDGDELEVPGGDMDLGTFDYEVIVLFDNPGLGYEFQ